MQRNSVAHQAYLSARVISDRELSYDDGETLLHDLYVGDPGVCPTSKTLGNVLMSRTRSE